MSTITQTDYQAILTRLNRNIAAGDSPSLDAAVHERDLHNEILDDVARRGWLAFHGSMARATHRTEGEPDFIICADGGRVLLVECKSRTGKLSVAQQAVIAHAAKLGTKIHICRSMAEWTMLADEK